ncbi:MgtC/SapB family protein [Nitrosomonas sp. HPC101]|uniref:MgtC/SapB family protein n=1 Tax=Nitrosomonas sp. HPC101 TaxID=1658667 RepID=UPI00136F991A|nr:MgtC/SapB family protein [Nitrosomonas sp. HPC101]MXS86356.1 MgtC/SapB family protein [Nitrosomonas sp. HPC101]
MDDLFFPEREQIYLAKFATSMAIGLLIGLERERHPAAKAGLRTFALMAMFGTLAAMLSHKAQTPWLLISGLLLTGIMMISSYRDKRDKREDPGTTTIAAILICYGIGALVWYEESILAVMLAIITTILLYFKTELRGISQNLSRKDLISILQFAVLSFIILPILPNKNYGPFDALNPYQIWLMMVLISGVSLTGYIALRFTGQRYGAVLLGLLGGLVSSTATTIVFSRRSNNNPDFSSFAVIVILLANLTLLIRLALISAVVSPEIFPYLLPILAGGFVLGLAASVFWWREFSQQQTAVPMPDTRNPAELQTAMSFGLLYTIVLLLSAWLSDIAGSSGLYAVALISGFTDVDAITLSSLRLYGLGKLEVVEVVTAITLAVIASLIFKLGLVFFIGNASLARRCVPGMVAIIAGMGGAFFLASYLAYF